MKLRYRRTGITLREEKKNMNNWTGLGRVGKDPQVKTISGKTMAAFSLAIDNGKDSNGNRKALWLTVQTWGKTAEVVRQYVRKGDQICVNGSLTTNEWTGNDGNKYFAVVINANNVSLVGGNKNNNGGSSTGSSGGSRNSGPNDPEFDPANLPF